MTQRNFVDVSRLLKFHAGFHLQSKALYIYHSWKTTGALPYPVSFYFSPMRDYNSCPFAAMQCCVTKSSQQNMNECM